MLSVSSFSNVVAYNHDNALTVLDTVVTKQVAALRDASAPGTSVDLMLGASDAIHIMVGGSNAIDISKKSSSNNTTLISATNSAAIEIQPGDVSKTVVLGDLTVSSSNNVQVIDTGLSELNVKDNVRITGSEVVSGDMLVQGAMIGSSMNVMRAFGSNVSVGYGFRVNDQSNLELYKYSSLGGGQVTKQLNVFGKGEATGSNDTTAFPVYGSGSNTAIGNSVTFAAASSNSGSGASSTPAVWFQTSYGAVADFSKTAVFDGWNSNYTFQSSDNAFNASNGVFTTPYTGIYSFSHSTRSGASYYHLTINNSANPTHTYFSTYGNDIIKLNQGDTVKLTLTGSATVFSSFRPERTWFSGTLIHKLA